MVKYGHKKEKFKKSSLLYNLKKTEEKTKKSIRRKVGVKALFQERRKNGAFQETLQNIRVSDREAHDYSNLNSEYFADLYCYLRKYF